MALTDFFRINMPYGMKKNANGEWFFFNREYVPLGWNNTHHPSTYRSKEYSELPVYTKYTGLTESKLLKLADDREYRIVRDDNGEIEKVFFYNDDTNPQSNPKYWDSYFKKIRLLATCKKKNNMVNLF